MPKEICVRIAVNAKLMNGALAAGLLAVLAVPLMPETLTMTSYYPTPLGVYNKLTATGATVLARDGGSVGIGTAMPTSAAAVEIKSTTKGFLPPRLTSAQRDAIMNPAPGLTIFNTTSKKIEFYNGAWGGGPAAAGVQTAVYMNDDPRRVFNTSYINNSGKRRLFVVTSSWVDLVLVVGSGETPICWGQYDGGGHINHDCMLMAVVPPGGVYMATDYTGFPMCGSIPAQYPYGCYKYWTEYDF